MRPVVIIPTYNERNNLPVVVDALLRTPDLRVLVVDDDSPDGTGAIADALARGSRQRVSVLHRAGPRGLGVSYVDGMQLALSTDATEICQMDADLSHDPSDVPRLLERSMAADLVIGSRYVSGGKIENWPRGRLLLSNFANFYVRVITGLRVRDCTSGFRCWRREALAQIPLQQIASNGYAFQVEMTWAAAANACRIAEVPVRFVNRRTGTSKMSAAVMLESMMMPWQLATRRRIR